MLRVGEVDVALVFRYLHEADGHGADAAARTRTGRGGTDTLG